MDPKLMKAVIAITLALVFYTIGVWSEHRTRELKPVHLLFFWLGFVMDTIGTHQMFQMSGQNNSSLFTAHGITGMLALLLMLVHAIWGTKALMKNDKEQLQSFHKFSLTVWMIWLVPFALGMIIGMR